MLFIYEIKRLLQAMRCQTSPQYWVHQVDDASTKLGQDSMSAGGGGLFHKFSSAVLFWQDDLQSCYSVKMMSLTSDTEQIGIKGSLSFLWPIFQAICLSHFVETLYCTVQGRQVTAETGMTIFEHSLAFAEAEAVVSNQLGWGPFSSSGTNSDKGQATETASPISAIIAVKRSRMLSQFNTTPEVLLVALISSLSHLTSQVLGVFDLQARYRLWSTGFWGLTFIGILIWSSMKFPVDSDASIDILRFPTVCIVGFVPHVLILIGIGICAIIYFLALALMAFSAVSQSGRPLTPGQRLEMARENLQANMHFSSIRVNRKEDFFSTLLKVGFTALTAASEAVFLNEGRPVGIRRWTWLEEDRMREIETIRATQGGNGVALPQTLTYGNGASIAEGVGLTDETGTNISPTATRIPLRGGYAREKGIKKVKVGESGMPRAFSGGVGATERSGRWMMVWELFRGISWLVVVWFVSGLAKALGKCGMHELSRWMTRLIYGKRTSENEQDASTRSRPRTLEFWLLSDDGELTLPRDDQVDVEAEMRKRLMGGSDGKLEPSDERELDQNIYGWWKQGGWFGEVDGSGDFVPSEEDDTTSSMYSESEVTRDSEWDTEDDDDDDDDGRTTPTKENPYPKYRTPSPSPNLAGDFPHLAQLLNPKTQAQRQEAQLLSYHLRNESPLTRAQYRQRLERERIQILTSNRNRSHVHPQLSSASASSPTTTSTEGPSLTPDEEAELLEHLILSRRSQQQQERTHSSPSSTSNNNNHHDNNWTSEAPGLGSDGPQCVVCQTSPRTILVWPCRCLSLCEDCRVSLAMNNFGSCVCCRRDVLGFSRIYIP